MSSASPALPIALGARDARLADVMLLTVSARNADAIAMAGTVVSPALVKVE